jgi:hypothetical protein
MPWTRRQVKYLLSSGSPLSGAQKEKMKGELHQNPAIGHEKKGSAAMKHNIHEMRIEVHRDGKGNVSGHTVHHHMMPKKASKSGAFMEHQHEAYSFGPDGHSKEHGHMLDHIGEHLHVGGQEAPNDAAKEDHENVGQQMDYDQDGE